MKRKKITENNEEGKSEATGGGRKKRVDGEVQKSELHA